MAGYCVFLTRLSVPLPPSDTRLTRECMRLAEATWPHQKVGQSSDWHHTVHVQCNIHACLCYCVCTVHVYMLDPHPSHMQDKGFHSVFDEEWPRMAHCTGHASRHTHMLQYPEYGCTLMEKTWHSAQLVARNKYM